MKLAGRLFAAVNHGQLAGWPALRVLGWGATPGALLALLGSTACGPSLAQNVTDVGLSCEQRQERLMTVLAQLPSEPLASPVAVQLPRVALQTGLISAPLLQLSDHRASLEQEPLEGGNAAQWAEDFASRWRASQSTTGRVNTTPLLIAAEWNVDVTSLYRFLHRVPESTAAHLLFARPETAEDPLAGAERYPLAQRVLLEPDARRRVDFARQGYDEYSTCAAISDAIDALSDSSGPERWPRLKEAMMQAIPRCDCGELDAEGLRHLLTAEQRAGSLSLGSIDVSFMRDLRCRASMPLLPVQELLREIEAFDAQFSASWNQGELHFQDAISVERLKNYLCVASPGETLATLQRDAATVYWKVGEACQAWRFLPLQRGAPMGTLRRVDAGASGSVHYWQAVEDLRLFGPAEPASLPTDAGPWECSEEFRLQQVDEHGIELDNGMRWYFDEASCRQAPAKAPAAGACAVRADAAPSASAPPTSGALKPEPADGAESGDADGAPAPSP